MLEFFTPENASRQCSYYFKVELNLNVGMVWRQVGNEFISAPLWQAMAVKTR